MGTEAPAWGRPGLRPGEHPETDSRPGEVLAVPTCHPLVPDSFPSPSTTSSFTETVGGSMGTHRSQRVRSTNRRPWKGGVTSSCPCPGPVLATSLPSFLQAPWPLPALLPWPHPPVLPPPPVALLLPSRVEPLNSASSAHGHGQEKGGGEIHLWVSESDQQAGPGAPATCGHGDPTWPGQRLGKLHSAAGTQVPAA